MGKTLYDGVRDHYMELLKKNPTLPLMGSDPSNALQIEDLTFLFFAQYFNHPLKSVVNSGEFRSCFLDVIQWHTEQKLDEHIRRLMEKEFYTRERIEETENGMRVIKEAPRRIFGGRMKFDKSTYIDLIKRAYTKSFDTNTVYSIHNLLTRRGKIMVEDLSEMAVKTAERAEEENLLYIKGYNPDPKIEQEVNTRWTMAEVTEEVIKHPTIVKPEVVEEKLLEKEIYSRLESSLGDLKEGKTLREIIGELKGKFLCHEGAVISRTLGEELKDYSYFLGVLGFPFEEVPLINRVVHDARKGRVEGKILRGFEDTLKKVLDQWDFAYSKSEEYIPLVEGLCGFLGEIIPLPYVEGVWREILRETEGKIGDYFKGGEKERNGFIKLTQKSGSYEELMKQMGLAEAIKSLVLGK